MNQENKGWIGVDLDGTLAIYDGWQGPLYIGAPIPAMVERVKRWLAEGREVRVFTARAYDLVALEVIQEWCRNHIGIELEVTCEKDPDMIELWDDRVVAVERNTGRALSPSTRGLQ